MCATPQDVSTFRINHTDPWVGSDPHRTSRTTTMQVCHRPPAPCSRKEAREKTTLFTLLVERQHTHAARCKLGFVDSWACSRAAV